MEQVLVVSSILLWILVLFNLLLTFALLRQINTGNPRKDDLKVGQQAPDFTAHTVEGTTVTLADYKGRSVAFLFISSTCSPCRDALPSYEALFPKAKQHGTELVLVSTADAEQTQGMVAQFNITLPVLVAPQESNSFSKDYKISGTPHYCLVDVDGKVQSTGFPSREWGNWKSLTEAWEGDKTLVVPSLSTVPSSERR